MKKIPENVLLIIKAVTPLVVIVILFFLLGSLVLTKVVQIQSEMAAIKQDKLVLIEKLDLLRTVAINGEINSDLSLSALPDSSPALAVVSQLKNLAAGSGLIMSSVESSVDTTSTEDLKSIYVDFNIAGTKPSVETFLLGINTIAPITMVNKVKISELNGSYTGEVNVKSYWSELPTQLPAEIEGLAELTDEDNQILAEISSLTQPTFVNLMPSEDSGKANPFAE